MNVPVRKFEESATSDCYSLVLINAGYDIKAGFDGRFAVRRRGTEGVEIITRRQLRALIDKVRVSLGLEPITLRRAA